MFHYSAREAAVSDPSGLSQGASFSPRSLRSAAPLPSPRDTINMVSRRARFGSATRLPTTRTSLPGHSPGKAFGVLSPPLVVIGIIPVGGH